MKLKVFLVSLIVLLLALTSCTSISGLFSALWEVGGIVLLSEGVNQEADMTLKVAEKAKGIYTGFVSVAGNEMILNNLEFDGKTISFELNGVAYSGNIENGNIYGMNPAEWVGTRIK